MHESRPHCDEFEQVLPPGGIARQVLAKQNSPEWQSALLAQTGSQRFALQASPAAQSELVEHLGNERQVPLLHPHEL